MNKKISALLLTGLTIGAVPYSSSVPIYAATHTQSKANQESVIINFSFSYRIHPTTKERMSSATVHSKNNSYTVYSVHSHDNPQTRQAEMTFFTLEEKVQDMTDADLARYKKKHGKTKQYRTIYKYSADCFNEETPGYSVSSYYNKVSGYNRVRFYYGNPESSTLHFVGSVDSNGKIVLSK